MEPSRIEAYLRATCSVLDFDIGELWCAKKDKDNKLNLKFMQLYTSPTYKDFHSLLIQPEKVPNYSSEDIKEHRFSPIICRSVCDGCQIVWANTRISGGLTGRSDLPLNTAVGIPVCSISQDLYILVLFAVGMVHLTHNSVEYLLSVVRAVTMNGGGFLSASLKLTVTAPLTNDFVGQWDIADLIKKYSQDVDFKLIPINTLQNYLDCHEILLFCDLFLDFKLTRNGMFTERHLESLREVSKATTNVITAAKLRSDSISSEAWNCDYDNYDSIMNVSFPLTSKGKNFPSFLLNNAISQQDIYGVYCAQDTNNVENINNSKHTEFNNNRNKDHTKLPDSISHLYSHVSYKISQSKYHEFMIAILGMTVFSSAELWVLAEDRSLVFLMAAVYRSTIMQNWISISENIRMNINCNDIVTNILQSNSFIFDPDFHLSNDRSTGPRAKQAKPLGINTAFGVPVPGINGVFGCMVFYSNKVILDLDPLIIQLLEKAVQIMSNTAQESLNSQVPLTNKSKSSTMKLKSENTSSSSYYHPHAPVSELETISNTDQIAISYNSNNSNMLEQSLDFNQRLQLCRSIVISKKNIIDINQSTRSLANSEKIYNEKFESINNVCNEPSGYETSNNNQCIDNYNEEHIGLYINDNEIGFSIENKSHKESDMPVIVYDDSSCNRNIGLMNNNNTIDDSLLSVDSVFDAAEALANFCSFPWNTSHIDSFDPVLIKKEISATTISPESKLDKKRKQPEDEFRENQLNPNTPAVEYYESSQVMLSKCKSDGCEAFVENENVIYCSEHRSVRRCQYDGCIKCAQGATKYCISHGGGRRCTFPNCFKGARDKFYCAAHGGGKRCCFEGGCSKSAVGGSDLCTAHGGGKRCKFDGCMKSSQSSTDYCVKHGGGKSCIYIGCNKVARGKTDFCAAHGGGVRCISTGCMKLAVGALHLCRIHNTEAKQRKNKIDY